MPIFKKPKEGAALQEMHEVKTINPMIILSSDPWWRVQDSGSHRCSTFRDQQHDQSNGRQGDHPRPHLPDHLFSDLCHSSLLRRIPGLSSTDVYGLHSLWI